MTMEKSKFCSKRRVENDMVGEKHINNNRMDCEVHGRELKLKLKLTRNQLVLLMLSSVLIFTSRVSSTDLVYVRSSSYVQLVTSSTMRWVKDNVKDAVTLGGGSRQTICRVTSDGILDIGVLSEDGKTCHVSPDEDEKVGTSSSRYQTLTGNAAHLIWVPWNTPQNPATGAVAISRKPKRYIATNFNHSMVGYLDPNSGLGAVIFPSDPSLQPANEALILVEIEPARYELFDVELKRDRGFTEEEINLTQGHLKYKIPGLKTYDEENENENENNSGSIIQHDLLSNEELSSTKNHHHGHENEPIKGRIESVLSYETDEVDYWGSGHLMARGLHTFITLPLGWSPNTKSIEWGIPFSEVGKPETVTASAELFSGTGLNMTLKGTKINGEMTYWATLRTYYKDGYTATRYIEGTRKLTQITNIRLDYGQPYFLTNGSLVPSPTTTTTSTTTSTTTTTTTSTTSRSISSTFAPKSSKSRASEGNEKMLADQHSSETLTFSASKPAEPNSASMRISLIQISAFPALLSLRFLL